MAKSVKALVEPAVLAWARKTAKLTVEEVSTRIHVDEVRISGWEDPETDDAPTVRQLQRLAGIYKRPLAVLYLSEPPTEFQALRDFRRHPGSTDPTSPDLVYQIRRAQERRHIALDLLSIENETPSRLELQASLASDPENVGRDVRDLLNVDEQQVSSWRDAREAFNGWRRAIESKGVLVFQVSGIPVSQMRGFSVWEPELPIIAVNMQDAPNGRMFSLLHEFTHLMLREGGICDFEEDDRSPSQAVEVFCNAVAGAALLPSSDLLGDPVVVDHGRGPAWSDAELQDLSRRHRVSREVVLRRLLRFERTTPGFYRQTRQRFLQEYVRARESSTGFAPPSTLAVARLGKPFARLVLRSYRSERISLNAVSDYLGVRVKHLPKIEELVAAA
ncbi:XRE family transcriptional regulator [Marinibaculum pumilum]|uniref:XRE family transcriptional regulator n=1 Tax=Marinibaculum pumilum TaxID=1766165 RepID=A0ABV7L4S6_9PROT